MRLSLHTTSRAVGSARTSLSIFNTETRSCLDPNRLRWFKTFGWQNTNGNSNCCARLCSGRPCSTMHLRPISASTKPPSPSARRRRNLPAPRSRPWRRTSTEANVSQKAVAADGRARPARHHGGRGMGRARPRLSRTCIAMEEVSRASASIGLSYGAHSNLVHQPDPPLGHARAEEEISAETDLRRARRRAGDVGGRRGLRRVSA